MIRFGPAGIPLSCKGRTLRDGIEDVHNMSLTALEVQMVRAGSSNRYPDDDEVGMCIREIEEDFVVEIVRDDEIITDPGEPIEEEDVLVYMPSGVTDCFGDLYAVGDMAKRLDVSVSLHTPYYMDLGSNDDLTESCIGSIRHAGLIMNALKGSIVVTSLGLYTGRVPDEEIDANILENVSLLAEWWKDEGLTPRLGLEVTGNRSVFGSLDQILGLCDEVDGVVPVVNFPHYHSRTDGALLDSDGFADLLDAVEPYCRGHMHASFSGIEYADGNEKRLTPIKKGDLRFEPLAEALCDTRPDATIISSSPLLEHDAMYMRLINERVLSRRVAKVLKEKKKAEVSAAPAEE
ncbi:MAG: TIM barrel protein [Candidatus Methanoplasma sp.]|jgi:deoxyribonuclease-4|nr:TIM barrel protein [Candidatus Methanoplasma sp.]